MLQMSTNAEVDLLPGITFWFIEPRHMSELGSSMELSQSADQHSATNTNKLYGIYTYIYKIFEEKKRVVM